MLGDSIMAFLNTLIMSLLLQSCILCLFVLSEDAYDIMLYPLSSESRDILHTSVHMCIYCVGTHILQNTQ